MITVSLFSFFILFTIPARLACPPKPNYGAGRETVRAFLNDSDDDDDTSDVSGEHDIFENVAAPALTLSKTTLDAEKCSFLNGFNSISSMSTAMKLNIMEYYKKALHTFNSLRTEDEREKQINVISYLDGAIEALSYSREIPHPTLSVGDAAAQTLFKIGLTNSLQKIPERPDITNWSFRPFYRGIAIQHDLNAAREGRFKSRTITPHLPVMWDSLQQEHPTDPMLQMVQRALADAAQKNPLLAKPRRNKKGARSGPPAKALTPEELAAKQAAADAAEAALLDEEDAKKQPPKPKRKTATVAPKKPEKQKAFAARCVATIAAPASPDMAKPVEDQGEWIVAGSTRKKHKKKGPAAVGVAAPTTALRATTSIGTPAAAASAKPAQGSATQPSSAAAAASSSARRDTTANPPSYAEIRTGHTPQPFPSTPTTEPARPDEPSSAASSETASDEGCDDTASITSAATARSTTTVTEEVIIPEATTPYLHGKRDGMCALLVDHTKPSELFKSFSAYATSALQFWQRHSEQADSRVQNSCAFWQGYLDGLCEANTLQLHYFAEGMRTRDLRALIEQVNKLPIHKIAKQSLALWVGQGCVTAAEEALSRK